MNSLEPQLLASVQAKLGMPFAEHYDPDICSSGTNTLDSCMQKGLTPSGYDCSGLIVASLCEVIGVPTEDWPKDLRHSVQLGATSTAVSKLHVGDVIYMAHPRRPRFKHLGIVSGDHRYIHATPDVRKGRAVIEEYIDYSASLRKIDVNGIISTLDM